MSHMPKMNEGEIMIWCELFRGLNSVFQYMFISIEYGAAVENRSGCCCARPLEGALCTQQRAAVLSQPLLWMNIVCNSPVIMRKRTLVLLFISPKESCKVGWLKHNGDSLSSLGHWSWATMTTIRDYYYYCLVSAWIYWIYCRFFFICCLFMHDFDYPIGHVIGIFKF